MKLEGEYIFDGPREEVWELVRDPQVLATALPGTQNLEQVSENEYAGKMQVRVGPLAGVFSGRVVVSDEVPPESYTLRVEGRGGLGFAKGFGNVQLVDQDDDTTVMTYQGELQIGGKLASVGQRLIETVSKSMTRQGLDSLNKALQARMAGQVEGTQEAQGEPVTYAPPSEVEFAAAVARDVVADVAAQIFSPEYQMAWMAAAVAIVGVLVGFWLGRRSANRR